MTAHIRRVVITGGPCSGKSTLIKALENGGYECRHEISRTIIREERQKGSGFVPWDNLPEFSKIVLKQRSEQFHISQTLRPRMNTVFYDRAIPDIHAYLLMDGHPPAEDLIKAGQEMRYHNTVFLAPFWEEIYSTDAERLESAKKARELQQYIQRSYELLGYELLLLPKVAVSERVNFILSNL